MKYIKIIDDGAKKTSELLDECRKLFPVWSYYGNDQLDRDFPPVKTEYEYEMTQEPSEEFANMSANELSEKYPDKHFMTLRERILFEIIYFKKTDEHLDVKNITLCTGSRYSDGYVPRCSLNVDGKFSVSWDSPGVAVDSLRARSAVSLEPSNFNPSYQKDTADAIVNYFLQNCGALISKKDYDFVVQKLNELSDIHIV